MNHQPTQRQQEGTRWWTTFSSILTYHEITQRPSKYIYSASSRQFEEHLKLLLTLNPSRSSKISVTFDDGKLTDYSHALPVLEKHRVPATFFVTVGNIGNDTSHMNWEQLKGLASLGHSVQAHGWSHLLLTKATPSGLEEEVVRSKQTLEDRLGLPVTSMSLPGGRWNEDVLKACADAGYTRVFHSDPWKPVQKWNDLEFLGRVMVRNTDSAERLGHILSRKGPDLFSLWVQHRMKEAAKKLFGDDTYHYLWRSMGRLAKAADARQ